MRKSRNMPALETVTLEEEPDSESLAIAKEIFGREISGMEICKIVPVPSDWQIGYTGIIGHEEADRVFVSAEAVIFAPDEHFAGVLVRDYALMSDGTRVVFHTRLELLEQYRKHGFSRTAVMKAPLRYKALGFEEIRLVAAMDGRFVWARLGFGWLTKATRDRKITEFSSFLSETYSGLTDAQILAHAQRATTTPEHLANAEDGDGRQIGKIFLLDEVTSPWEALLRL
ncbi:MAG: hypothetical protein JWM53_1884 [bacterium]|nr:hypothetical protein [bacterium]